MGTCVENRPKQENTQILNFLIFCKHNDIAISVIKQVMKSLPHHNFNIIIFYSYHKEEWKQEPSFCVVYFPSKTTLPEWKPLHIAQQCMCLWNSQLKQSRNTERNLGTQQSVFSSVYSATCGYSADVAI